MTKEIGETYKLKGGKFARLVNPLELKDMPDNFEVHHMTILIKKYVDPVRLQLLQGNIHKILGDNYLRSWFS